MPYTHGSGSKWGDTASMATTATSATRPATRSSGGGSFEGGGAGAARAVLLHLETDQVFSEPADGGARPDHDQHQQLSHTIPSV